MTRQAVLVTGATGFVGSHLVRRLVRDQFDVHVLSRPQSNWHRLTDVFNVISRHEASLLDRSHLSALIKTIQPQRIFHLAAATVVAGATGSTEELINVNLIGTANLIDACEDVAYDGLVVTGDSFEYSASTERLRESDVCRPNTLHGITKLGATRLARAAAAERGRPIVALRLFSTYGPADNPKRLVPQIIAGFLNGTPVRLSRPEIARDWVFVDDVVELYLEVASRARELAGNVFNAGSGVAVSIGEMVEVLQRLTGTASVPEWGAFPAPPHDDTPWIADPRHTFAMCGWRPNISLEDGLLATITAVKRPGDAQDRS